MGIIIEKVEEGEVWYREMEGKDREMQKQER